MHDISVQVLRLDAGRGYSHLEWLNNTSSDVASYLEVIAGWILENSSKLVLR